MKRVDKPIRWWIRFILVVTISILCFGVSVSKASTLSESGMKPGYPIDSDEQMSLVTIEPALTNPAETPIREALPQQISALDWFGEVVATVEHVEPEDDSLDTLLKQWLSSVQHLLETQ